MALPGLGRTETRRVCRAFVGQKLDRVSDSAAPPFGVSSSKPPPFSRRRARENHPQVGAVRAGGC